MLAPRIAPLDHPAGLERELTLTLPSEVVLIDRAVSLVCDHVESAFFDARAIQFNLRVALSEALANAILYGNGCDAAKTVELTARYGPNAVELHVTDQGPGFDPATVPDPTLPENIAKADGRGVFLIRRLMDDVRFNAKGNSVCMTLRRS